MATVTPRAEPYRLEPRQNPFDGIGSALSSIFIGPSSSTSASTTARPTTTSSSSSSFASSSTSSTRESSTSTTSRSSTTSQQPSSTTTARPSSSSVPPRVTISETSTSITVSVPTTSTTVEASTSEGSVVSVTRVQTTSAPVVVVTQSPISVPATGAGSANGETTASSNSDSGRVGGIVGGVVGGLALLTLLALLAFIWRRRKARTGHGYLLCFGTRPRRGAADEWPTFDPVADDATAVGTVVGGASAGRAASTSASSRGGGRRKPAVAQATLPEGFEGADPEMLGEDSSSGGHMREYAGGVGVLGAGAAAAYPGPTWAHASQDALSAGHLSNPNYGMSSEDNHAAANIGAGAAAGWPAMGVYRGPGSPPPPPTAAVAGGVAGGVLPTHVPEPADYTHLDPPAVQEARAREQAALAAAQGALDAPYFPPSSPPPPQASYGATNSPPSNHPTFMPGSPTVSAAANVAATFARHPSVGSLHAAMNLGQGQPRTSGVPASSSPPAYSDMGALAAHHDDDVDAGAQSRGKLQLSNPDQ